MKSFLLKTIILVGLWGAIFIFEGTFPSLPLIVICSFVMVLYFFLPISPKSVYLHIFIHLILFISFTFLSSHLNPFLLLLILFFSIIAIDDLQSREHKILSSVVTSIFVLLSFNQMLSLPLLLGLVFFYFLASSVNELREEKKDLREMYEELLGEYRRQKRRAALSETVTRNEERTRIARDIHDSVGHKLTALLMQIEILSNRYGEDQYVELKKFAKESLEETRYAVKALKIEEQEGIPSILQLIKRLEAESHILVNFTSKHGILSTKLTNEQSIVLYRVIQEGLTNAMRHAHSKEVHIVIGKTAIDDIEIQIRNRIYTEEPIQEGFGLQNMRNRLEEIGGTLHIYIAENNFVVRAVIPIVDRDKVEYEG